MILLTGLKNVFQKQLPNMPKEYITKVVYDRSHCATVLVEGMEIIGGICYRPFLHRKFVEIVFAAVRSNEQVKGYGSAIMNQLKEQVKASGDYRYLITYADNYAIGYFKKQGFTQDFSVLDEKVWKGYIKDYEGANPMVCVLLPKVDYLNLKSHLAVQKQVLNDIIGQYTLQKVTYKGLESSFPIDPMSIPGIKESGWTPELAKEHKERAKNEYLNLFKELLNDLKNHHTSWPFLKPVDGNTVLDYYDLIKQPMDLGKIGEKVEKDEYLSIEAFKNDVQLIFNNCRSYNAPNTTFYVDG